jgi:hypothetical protein
MIMYGELMMGTESMPWNIPSICLKEMEIYKSAESSVSIIDYVCQH